MNKEEELLKLAKLRQIFKWDGYDILVDGVKTIENEIILTKYQKIGK